MRLRLSVNGTWAGTLTIVSQALTTGSASALDKAHTGRMDGEPPEKYQNSYDGFNVNGKRLPQKGYITDEPTDYALDWLDHRQHTDKNPSFSTSHTKQYMLTLLRPTAISGATNKKPSQSHPPMPIPQKTIATNLDGSKISATAVTASTLPTTSPTSTP